jgi:hypothetical protein
MKTYVLIFIVMILSTPIHAAEWILERDNIRTVTLDLLIVGNDIAGSMRHQKTNLIKGRLYDGRGGTIITFVQKGDSATPGIDPYISTFSGVKESPDVYKGMYFDIQGRSGAFRLTKK